MKDENNSLWSAVLYGISYSDGEIVTVALSQVGNVGGAQWFKDRGQWQDGSAEPVPGMIIFFDWERDGETDHVGIVEKVENGTIYTVEGNSGDSCRKNHYAVGYYEILGYGCPAY